MVDWTALSVAVILTSLILVMVAYAWWMRGWTKFSFAAGAEPSWPGPVGGLRFRDCKFQVVRSDGVAGVADVTAALNSMSAAYSSPAKGQLVPQSLSLVAPLNSFSFPIKGFNDRQTVSDPSARPWCTAPPGPNGVCPGTAVSLVGYYKNLQAAA